MKKLIKFLTPTVTRLDLIVLQFFMVFAIFTGFIALFSGCAGMTTGAPPIPPTLCEDQAEYKADSILLKVQEQYKIPLNEVYYGLIDTTRIMMITNVTDKKWVGDYLNRVGEFYKTHYPNLTHDQLITYMVSEKEWGEKVELAVSILSTRIGYFRSAMFINPYDNCLYENGWMGAKKLLFIQ